MAKKEPLGKQDLKNHLLFSMKMDILIYFRCILSYQLAVLFLDSQKISVARDQNCNRLISIQFNDLTSPVKNSSISGSNIPGNFTKVIFVVFSPFCYLSGMRQMVRSISVYSQSYTHVELSIFGIVANFHQSLISIY